MDVNDHPHTAMAERIAEDVELRLRNSAARHGCRIYPRWDGGDLFLDLDISIPLSADNCMSPDGILAALAAQLQRASDTVSLA